MNIKKQNTSVAAAESRKAILKCSFRKVLYRNKTNARGPKQISPSINVRANNGPIVVSQN